MPLIFQKVSVYFTERRTENDDADRCCRWAWHEFQEGQNHDFSATIDTYIPLWNGLIKKLVYN